MEDLPEPPAPPPANLRASMSSQSTSSSMRLETFTEAVPLSLSSMAHASLPLEDGVLDGIRQVLHHTLLSCVNYARIMHPPHLWTLKDLTTSSCAWQAHKIPADEAPKDVPYALEKMQFKHQYQRSALIYLKPTLPVELSPETERQLMKEWTKHVGILGLISLLYISTEPLTQQEMDGEDLEDLPPCILYKAVVEYRSLPPTGNQQAIQAEELSMLSFGGSVDDLVKYGALASLYDVDAKYVLEIYSVRGKKYKFDLMDSTLANGTVPQLPSSREGDPFVKSLCVTVTDHAPSMIQTTIPEEKPEEGQKYAITRMQLLLEGKPRKGNDFSSLPDLNYFTDGIKASYLLLNPQPQAIVTALPSGHSLLLDPKQAGRIYINGHYVTTWGRDPRIGSHGTALFGMDLHSIPMWHGRIVNYEDLKVAYAILWHEILVDARLAELKLATRLLYRLIYGRDPPEDEDSDYDEDELPAHTGLDCLEADVLSSGNYDRVGIAPKALATRFGVDFGADAFPCEAHEVEWCKSALPDRKPVVVPHRSIGVLRRGGYFDVQRTSDDLWFLENRKPKAEEEPLIDAALANLDKADCADVTKDQIAFCSLVPVKDVVRFKSVCRFSPAQEQYAIHEKYLDVAVAEYLEDGKQGVDEAKVKAYLLGLYIAKEHRDGKVLARYVLRNQPF